MRLSLLIFLILIVNQLFGQNSLDIKFEKVAATVDGKVGVSALHLETGKSFSFNGDEEFPMQSVYKFPIAMVMLNQIDAGKFSLDDTVSIDKAEYIPKAGHSPLRDSYPDGVNLTIENILEYNVAKSDGTACDVLLRLLGGTDQVEKHIHDLGIINIAISTTEMVQVANDTIQYQNWSTPIAMNEILSFFFSNDYLTESSKTLLLEYMSVSNKWFDKRLKGLLPEGTKVFHKTGSSRTYNGLTRATNDVGIIVLPDRSHLAVSVFVSDSYNSGSEREMAIASLAKAAYDYWAGEK